MRSLFVKVSLQASSMEYFTLTSLWTCVIVLFLFVQSTTWLTIMTPFFSGSWSPWKYDAHGAEHDISLNTELSCVQIPSRCIFRKWRVGMAWGERGKHSLNLETYVIILWGLAVQKSHTNTHCLQPGNKRLENRDCKESWPQIMRTQCPWAKPCLRKQVHDLWADFVKMHLDLPSVLELSAGPLTLGQKEYLPRMLGSQAYSIRNGELESLWLPRGSLMAWGKQFVSHQPYSSLVIFWDDHQTGEPTNSWCLPFADNLGSGD